MTQELKAEWFLSSAQNKEDLTSGLSPSRPGDSTQQLPLLWPAALRLLSFCFSSWFSRTWRPSSFSRAWILVSYCLLLSASPSPRWSGGKKAGGGGERLQGRRQPPWRARGPTSALLQQQLHVLLMSPLLQGQLAVHLQALPLQGRLQPVHQPLLLLQLPGTLFSQAFDLQSGGWGG